MNGLGIAIAGIVGTAFVILLVAELVRAAAYFINRARGS